MSTAKRLSELKEQIHSLRAIHLFYRHILETQDVSVAKAEAALSAASQSLEALLLNIAVAPTKMAYCEKILKTAEKEVCNLADSKIRQLLSLKEKVAKLEAELL